MMLSTCPQTAKPRELNATVSAESLVCCPPPVLSASKTGPHLAPFTDDSHQPVD
jgi:hypothetical protein